MRSERLKNLVEEALELTIKTFDLKKVQLNEDSYYFAES